MLKNMNIRSKLLVLLLLPVMGLLFFSSREIIHKYSTLHKLNSTKNLVGLSVRSAALVHELQKERGLSAGFLNAKGNAFRDELGSQRRLSDDQFDQLRAYVAGHPDEEAIVKPSLDAALNLRRGLQEMRTRVDNVAVAAKDAFDYYSAMNRSCLDVVASVAKYSMDPTQMRTAIAYLAFSEAKEETGKERATINAVLASKNFTPETYQRMFALMATQKSHLDEFRKFGSDESVAEYDALEKSEQFDNVEKLRTDVVSKGMAGGFTISPELWFRAITDKINLMKAMEDKLAREVFCKADTMAAHARLELILSVTVSAVMGLLTVVISILIVNNITRPIVQLAVDTTAVAGGDLTVRIAVDSSDEIGRLAEAFRTMTDNLRATIGQVAATSSGVAQAAGKLHATAEQIEADVESASSQAQAVAVAGVEMAATAGEIARNCQSAATGAMDASTHAQDGSAVVNRTVQSITQIAARVQDAAVTVASLGSRSDDIEQIIGTIEDIAGQTSLLALNAAIEAARAGEMGRGFAVVADEVRALADRTTTATKEIGDMIRAIQDETRAVVSAMEEGVSEVRRGTGEAAKSEAVLNGIIEQVGAASLQISQIATAAEEQTASTGEITDNMNAITAIILRTSDGAHETTVAAAGLARLATDLERMVAGFRI